MLRISFERVPETLWPLPTLHALITLAAMGPDLSACNA